MHKTLLIGNLGSDPEQRETGNGEVTNFPVAVNERWKDSEGERQEKTIWYRVSAWGKLGEICAKHLHKGRKVYIEGTMVADRASGGPNAWIREDDTPAATFDLRAESIEFLDSANENVG